MKIVKLTTLAFSLFSMLITLDAQTAVLPYQNAELTPAQRAEDLLRRLTLEEKVSLMQNNSPAIERLGIKPYEWWNEALHGVARAGLATVFPQAIGMAATFDEEALYRTFSIVSDEARAKNNYFVSKNSYARYQGLTMWTPNINIFRDPRWGRGQETYGEDPYLTSIMGQAVVRGLQGPATNKYNKLHACAKHYAVHSGPEWCRHSFDAKNISTRDLRETYLPAFQDLVQKARVKEVMCAYNAFEGEPCCGSEQLLTSILRNEWGYDGLVVSDCWAINDFFNEDAHHTHPNATNATAAAVIAGTDLECGSSYKALVNAVKNGIISEKSIDISVYRLLKARFELGLMDEGVHFDIPMSVVGSKEHGKMALEMAQKSIVLLQNNKQTLPLSKEMTVAVVGPNANDSIMQWGNYNGEPPYTVTLLEGIQAKLPKAKVLYFPLCGLTDKEVYQSLWNSCSANGKTGFSSTYWNNSDLSGNAVAEQQAQTPITFFTMGATTPAPGVDIKKFSSLYKATFTPDHNGKAFFRISHNGEIVIKINDKVVLEKERVKNPSNIYELDFVKGQKYEIALSFVSTRVDSYLTFDLLENNDKVEETFKKLRKADAIIYAGGISPRLEGEEMKVDAKGFRGGDRDDIELPDVQREMIKRLASLGKRLIYVNFSGSAIGMEPETKQCGAIIQAWYPGQEGGTAIADVIFGDVNPSGRLPLTFYKNVGQLPDFLDYSMKGRTYRYMTEKPLFAFGHGLSYTTFTYKSAAFAKETLCYGDSAVLRVEIANTGKRDGDEVIQVYLSRPSDTEGPQRTLRAIKRVSLKAGDIRTVEIAMPRDAFDWFDVKSERMKPLVGEYVVYVGGSSDNTPIQTKINIE
jgi:beta-glucosidase